MLKYNWFDELLYQLIMLAGDDSDKQYILYYKDKFNHKKSS